MSRRSPTLLSGGVVCRHRQHSCRLRRAWHLDVIRQYQPRRTADGGAGCRGHPRLAVPETPPAIRRPARKWRARHWEAVVLDDTAERSPVPECSGTQAPLSRPCHHGSTFGRPAAEAAHCWLETAKSVPLAPAEPGRHHHRDAIEQRLLDSTERRRSSTPRRETRPSATEAQ